MGAAVMLLGAVLFVFSGCGDGGAQQKMDAAMQSVRTSLDLWKRGERVGTLKTSPTPIEFFDDDCEKSARLVQFEIHKTYMETDGTARCSVGLVVQHGDKPPERVQVTYQVVTKDNKTVIARDPFS
jgi:hypothetical protein